MLVLCLSSWGCFLVQCLCDLCHPSGSLLRRSSCSTPGDGGLPQATQGVCSSPWGSAPHRITLTSSDEVSGGCKTCNCFFFTTNTPANSLFSMAYGKICLFRTFSGFCSCWTSNVSPSQLSACWKTVIILYHLVRDVLWWCS